MKNYVKVGDGCRRDEFFVFDDADQVSTKQACEFVRAASTRHALIAVWRESGFASGNEFRAIGQSSYVPLYERPQWQRKASGWVNLK